MNNNKVGWIEVEVSKLHKSKWNYKKENKELTKKLINQIKKNGVIENIIIREIKNGKGYEIVNGNHRLDVFKELKIDKVIAFNLGKITDNQAKRIAIETNESKYEPDYIILAKILKELSIDYNIEDLAKTMPFSDNEIKNLVDVSEFKFEDEPKEIESYEKNIRIIKIDVDIEIYNRWNDFISNCFNKLGLTKEAECLDYAIKLAEKELSKIKPKGKDNE